jgi:hypothetical protein
LPLIRCAPDFDEFLVPLPKSEQRTEAVGELNWYDLDLRLTLRRHIRRMKKSAPLFNYFGSDQRADERVVSQEGIEPSTRRLRVCCSAN